MPDVDVNGLLQQARDMTENIMVQFQAVTAMFKGLGLNDAQVAEELKLVTTEVKKFEVTY